MSYFAVCFFAGRIQSIAMFRAAMRHLLLKPGCGVYVWGSIFQLFLSHETLFAMVSWD